MHPEDVFSHNWLIKRAVNTQVRDHLPRLRGLVLDLGCGTRPYAADILAYAEAYVGLDWSNTLHRLKADVVADLTASLPILDGSVDGVVCFEVLEHLPEPAALLAEAFRVMRPGSTLLLSVPFQWWVHEAPWDYYRYTRHGLEYLLRKAGFDSIEVAPTTGFWSMWLLKLNYQSARLLRGSRFRRRVTRGLLVPFWWVNQMIGARLDRIAPDANETAGYFVVAMKP